MKLKPAILIHAIFLLQCFFSIALAQNLQVTGRVVAQTTNEKLSGATVTVKGTSIATSTDADGNFTISVPSNNRTLVITYAGMSPAEVTVSGSGQVEVVLSPAANTMNEVVVIGYGTQRRAAVTGAISTVRSEELNTVSQGRIDQALQGRTAGVSISPNSGAPGAGMSIRIRGTGSNSGAEPLFIVDGVRTGGIDNLDPSEIASIEILKDAASAAIYGSAAANGVILITTKTGRRNQTQISYSGQYGRQSVTNLPKMMNAQQYVQYLLEAKATGAPTLSDLAAVQGTGTDWFGAMFQEAPLNHHSISFSGGGDKSTFLLNGTYFSQDGIIGGSKSRFNRYTARINTDQQIKSWLNIGQRLSYANIKRSGISENSEFGSIVGSAVALDPLTPITYTGALTTRAQNALNSGRVLVKDPNGYYYGISDYIFGEYGNPLARIDVTNNDLTQHKVEGNVFADITPFKNFKFTTRFGLDGAFQREHAWTPRFWFSTESLNTQASGSDWQNNWFSWQWENFANYQRNIGSHNLALLLGTSANRFTWNYLGGSYSGLFREELLFSYADGTPDLQDRIGSNANKTSLLSYFGRINYDFKNKYLFSASLRRDGASVFADGHKWGSFPAVSAGWVISNEDFYPTSLSNKMNYLKLRGSWGQNGSTSNVGIGAWQALIGAVTPGYPDANGNFVVGAAPTALPNPELKWETSEQMNVGADLSFLSNRLSLMVDYFKKTTIDLLTPGAPATPGFVGNTLAVINAGEIQNKGWEFELGFRSRPTSTSGFTYNLSGNLSTLKNTVTELSPYYNELGGAGVGTGWNATVFKVGLPVWSFRGYQTAGIFQSQDEINAYMSKTGITGYTPSPGEPIVVDVNGDKQISTADQTFIGSPHPELMFGGRVNLGYKGFDLLVFGQGQSGNEILMGFNRTDRPTANRPEFFYLNRWTGPGSTNKWFGANTTNQYVYNSDMMIFDGSYFRIRQLQLGYSLPANLMRQSGLSGARVYVSLDDYFIWSRYPGMYPEGGSGGANSRGIDRGAYPLSKKALVGLSINF